MPPKRTANQLPAEQPTRVSSRAKIATDRYAPYPSPEQVSEAKKSTSTKSRTAKTSSTKASSTKTKKASAKAKKPAAEQANIARKRQAPETELDEAASKRAKTAAKPASKVAKKTTASKKARAPAQRAPPPRKILPVINSAPAQKLDVLVVGEGESGELGLGTGEKAIGVKRFRLNPLLSATEVGVVHLALGSMHATALTHDNKILTWGVNDEGALGRDTTWDGVEDDDNDTGLNPFEVFPTAIPADSFPEGTVFTQLAAGDSCTFALTAEGQVYGWGMFRDNQGPLGFSKDVKMAVKPTLIPELQKITRISCGSNHAIALDDKGNVFAWGAGQQNQLGRRLVERTRGAGLEPREVGLPKKKIKYISTGSDHSFAIANNDVVYSWGLNNYGQCGISENAGEDSALIPTPTIVKQLGKYKMAMLDGGAHHSLGITDDGTCLTWGRADGGQVGIDVGKVPENDITLNEHGKPGLVKKPTPIPGIDGAYVASSSDHSIIISKTGQAYSWGFSGLYQTGLGTDQETVETATLVDNAATRERKLIWAGTGSQYSMLTAAAGQAPLTNGATPSVPSKSPSAAPNEVSTKTETLANRDAPANPTEAPSASAEVNGA